MSIAIIKEFCLIFAAILIGKGIGDIVGYPIVLLVLGLVLLVMYIALELGVKKIYS